MNKKIIKKRFVFNKGSAIYVIFLISILYNRYTKFSFYDFTEQFIITLPIL